MRLSVFFSAISLACLSLPVFAAQIVVEAHPTSNHGRLLKMTLEQGASAAGGGITGLLFVEDDVSYLSDIRNKTSIDDYARQYWNTEVDLLCGIRGEAQVLVSLDNGAGTPTDYMRQTMIASGLDKPLTVFTGFDLVKEATVYYVAAETGHKIVANISGSDFENDGRLLSKLRRAGSGMAFVDLRHAGAPGFAVALTMTVNNDAGIPSVSDYDILDIPPRFAAVYAATEGDDTARAMAMRACEEAGSDALSADDVVAAKGRLLEMYKRVLEAGRND